MSKRTIEILTSYPEGCRQIVMGNVAIARGAIEAGVRGVFAYPGTPSTEISEVFRHVRDFSTALSAGKDYAELVERAPYFEYSVNEKIALEKAIAFSLGGASALVVMKNVGMNVASDALMSITYQVIGAPLVIVVCDDPGCHSSSNEQDSRYWGPLANAVVFSPSSPEQALENTRSAFDLSSHLGLPVIIRPTTRVSHGRGVVTFGNINIAPRRSFQRVPEMINIPARTARAHAQLLSKINSAEALRAASEHAYLSEGGRHAHTLAKGVICSGITVHVVREALSAYDSDERPAILEVVVTTPFPAAQVADFVGSRESVLVVEELDPIVEDQVRLTVQKHGNGQVVYGKGYSTLSPTGEYNPDIVSEAVRLYLTPIEPLQAQAEKLEGADEMSSNLPMRPPVLCAGCPHRATFYLLKLAIPREHDNLVLCGDIGCFGLGALPPLRMMDTINHMGMSIAMAQGLYEAFRSSGTPRKVVALVGDGTFFHSGQASLLNAVYTGADILVVIFDNRTVGMTGQQPNPGAETEQYHEVDLVSMLRGMGVEMVESFDPFDLRYGMQVLDKAMQHRGVSCIIARSPCVFLDEARNTKRRAKAVAVNPNLCNACGNHVDPDIVCSRCYSPRSNLSRARAKLLSEIQVTGESQPCPANICNHGFFNSILEGDYESALAIVRDKMLFARTCGDICHRPCESTGSNPIPVPIRAMKKFVSSFDDAFRDFTAPLRQVQDAIPANRKAAIIGAGPAGLSAAYDLVRNGYNVSVYDQQERIGGMVTHVIPSFRMDKTGYEYEALQLTDMGVHFYLGKALGTDVKLEDLQSEYDAVILATGMWKSRELDALGLPPDKSVDAIKFLQDFGRNDVVWPADTDVLVIGGGNSSIDAARAARRSTKGRVIVSCIEQKDSMPAFAEEVRHAEEEGIEIITQTRPIHHKRDAENRIAMTLQSAVGENITVNVHLVIVAIGQEVPSDVSQATPETMHGDRGRLRHNNGVTDKAGLFVAGDLANGNHMSVIGAIASGRRAATEVRRYLEGYKYEYEGTAALDALNAGSMMVWPTEQIDPGQPELFAMNQACAKCNHCIDSFGCPALVIVEGKVVVDDDRCTLCGLCIDVCPNGAIHWVYDEAMA